jgi:type I restriction enzyme S subunit
MMADGWERQTFYNLIEAGLMIISDGYRAKNEELGGDGYIFLRAGHVTDTHIDFKDVERFHRELSNRVSSKLSQPGDVVVTTKGNSTGRVTYVTPDLPTFVYSPHLSFWRSLKPKVLAPRFLRYWSRGKEFRDQLEGLKASTDMAPYLSLNDQKRLRITLPTSAEQRAIGHILGTLDDKIELNRRMNETLEAMARALFKSWFVDFDPVRAKAEKRQPVGMDAKTATLFPNSFYLSEFGETPEGWRTGKLEDILTVIETGSRPKGGVSGITHGVPSVGAESIVSIGRFDYGKTKYVPREFYEAMRRGHVRDYDVLLYKDGGRPGEFEPHVSIFGDGFPFGEFCINEHVYRLRTEPNLPQSYFYFWLESDLIMAEMRNRGTGVAIPGLNSTAVKALPVLIPSSPVVAAFNRRTEPLIRRIFCNCNESRTLAALRDALLPKLLSGEIRVREAEREVEQVA